jgi:hypothetical protein
MDPDNVTRLVRCKDSLCECQIGGLVRGPPLVSRGVLGGDVLPEEIVEEWPEGWI